jgi:CheY-specific phosphatase CheX
MLQIAEDEADNAEMVVAALSEVVNVIGGRIKTALGEKILDVVLGLPAVQEKSAGELQAPPAQALLMHFAGGEDLRFSVSLIPELPPQTDLREEPVLAETDAPTPASSSRRDSG